MIVCIFSSCTDYKQKETMDFNNQDIYVYINDMPVYESNMSNYIQMKTIIMDNYKTDPYGMLEHQSTQESENIVYSIFKAKAQKYEVSDKVEDYYITLIIKDELNRAWAKNPEYINALNTIVDDTINDLLVKIENQTKDPLIELFESIAEKNGMTVNEVIEDIYKPYLISVYEYEGYFKYYLDNVYGKEIKSAEEMENPEYLEYYMKLITGYDDYLNQVFKEKYTITYRPTSTKN